MTRPKWNHDAEQYINELRERCERDYAADYQQGLQKTVDGDKTLDAERQSIYDIFQQGMEQMQQYDKALAEHTLETLNKFDAQKTDLENERDRMMAMYDLLEQPLQIRPQSQSDITIDDLERLYRQS